MPAEGVEIRPLNLRSANDHEYACLNVFENLLRGEVLPEDPPFPYSEDVQRWRTMPDFQKETAWAAWDKIGIPTARRS